MNEVKDSNNKISSNPHERLQISLQVFLYFKKVTSSAGETPEFQK